MSDEAAVAAPAGEAVISDNVSSSPQALGSQTVSKEQPQQPKPEAKAEPPKEVAKSAREAISRAQEKYKAEQAAPKQEPKAEPKAETKANDKPQETAKQERARSETGQFASTNPKPQATEAPEQQARGQSEGSKFDAPARFNAQAKADWANASDSVKAETIRAIKELEDGHTKYKASHERYEQLRQFDETAKSNNRDLRESLQQVIEFETTMKSNPLAAIDFALRHAGPRKSDGSPLTINDIVQHISGQTTDQRLQTAQAEIHQLRQKLQEKETQEQLPKIIDEFKSAEGHERFDELTPVMIPLLKAGHTLETAYELADALKPATQAKSEPLTPAHEAQAQTLANATPAPKPAANPAGLKSISGNPSLGSNPSGDRAQIPLKETPSIKDSLRKAMSRAS
ncbi:hypothetical protein NL154_05665 [Rhizobium sp. YTUHZ044]|uniref:hypothetical protein n=1 Tax=Rhizobium sp. YTUHZ044 TaxID=2962678 RepID=UPI003DA8AA16